MAKDTIRYRKIARRSTFSNQRLYLAEDHLLAVDGTMSESYRRFYYRDIQAILLRPTAAYAVINTLLVGLLLLIALLFLTGDPVAHGFGIVLGGTTLFVLFLNLVKGRTCECRFLTSVQSFRIRALHRRGKAHRVLNRIMPMLQAAQGDFDPEELRQRLRPQPVTFSAEPPSSPATTDETAEETF